MYSISNSKPSCYAMLCYAMPCHAINKSNKNSANCYFQTQDVELEIEREVLVDLCSTCEGMLETLGETDYNDRWVILLCFLYESKKFLHC